MSENMRKLTPWAAFIGGSALFVWAFFDVLVEMTDAVLVRWLIGVMVEATVVLALGIAAIIIGWIATELFKRARLKPHPKHGWTVHENRLMFCSFAWTSIANIGILTLKYVYLSDLRTMALNLAYITAWTVVVAAVSIPLYDIVAKRWWPGFLRAMTPTKRVQNKVTGEVEERDITQPSSENEKTLLPDRKE